MPIGPQLPPHLALANPEDNEETLAESPKEDDDDDDFGPALPPHLAAKRKAAPKTRDIGPQRPSPGPSVGPSIGPSTGPSIGPSVGPSRARGPVGPSHPTAPDSDSDDDFVGPVPSAAPVEELSAADAFRAREARWAKERAEGKSAADAAASKPQRAEWMLVPPSGGVLGGAATLDPTKRPTSFNKTSRAGVTAEEQRVWTESPAEKAQRLADEVAGVKRGREGRPVEDDYEERRRRRERDDAMRKNVEAYSKANRGGSLLSQHQKRKAESKDEEDAPAFWDHTKHMGITGRLLSNEERAAKIKDARNLNDRFGHGKGGAFDY